MPLDFQGIEERRYGLCLRRCFPMLLDSGFPWLPLFPEFFILKPIEQDMQMMDDLAYDDGVAGAGREQVRRRPPCYGLSSVARLGLRRCKLSDPSPASSALPPSNPFKPPISLQFLKAKTLETPEKQHVRPTTPPPPPGDVAVGDESPISPSRANAELEKVLAARPGRCPRLQLQGTFCWTRTPLPPCSGPILRA